MKAYRQTDKGKEAGRKYARKYQQTKKSKAYQKQFRQIEVGIATRKRASAKFHKTEKHKKAYKKYCIKNPEKRHAKNAVNYAVISGKLPRPDTLLCHYCPKPAQQYHHHKGYAKEHWLDVVPVCIRCHYNLHNQLMMLG